jgi:hypothetical protein
MDAWKQKLKLRLPVLILLLATVLFWSLYDRYEPAGPILLKNPSLADGTNIRGEVSGAGGRFFLNVPRKGRPARINFRLPEITDYESIRIRGRIKVDGVVEGKHSWSCARLLVTQYDANNKWMSGHHGLVAEKGTKDWETHEDVFEIFTKADRADVVLQQSGSEGLAAFDQIEVQPVRLRVSFVGWRILFAGLWLLAAGLYFPRCRLHRRKLKVLIFLNAVAILAGTLMPSDWITAGSEKVRSVIQELHTPESPPEKVPPPGKKKAPATAPPQEQMDWFVEMEMKIEAHRAGHFILFASLCFLVYCSAALERQHPAYFAKVGFDILLFAAVTEALQFLTLDRMAGVLDLRTDLYGMAAALVVFLAVRPFILKQG